MRAGGRDLERTPRALLPAHVGEIGNGVGLVGVSAGSGSNAGASISPRKYATTSPRCRTGTGSMPASAASGADSAAQTTRVEPGAAGALGNGERPRRPADAAVERELADRGVLGEPLGRNLPRRASTASEIGRSNPDPSLRSAAGARLTVIRRLSGHSSDGGDDAASDAVLRLLARPVGEPDDREARNARLEVRLDLDLARLEADERVGDRACEHPRHGRHGGRSQVVTPPCRKSYKRAHGV